MTTKDYVYSLPPELLTEIFKLAYTNLFGNGKGLEPSADSLISLPHVKNLALVYEHFSSRYTAHLRSAEGEVDHPQLLPLLPVALSSLSLFAPTSLEGYGFGTTVDHLLPRFSRLQYLHLGQGMFDHRTLLDNLHALPFLSSHSFEPGPSFRLESFSDLVAGPQRHPSLKHLLIDSIYPGKRGWRVKEQGRLHPQHMQDSYHFDDEREYGGGSGGFTASSMHELIFQCKRGAVRIEGTAVEAAEVYRDWIQQVDDCLTWWAGEKGFSREVVEEVEEKLNDLFGCEAVEAWSIQNEGALHDAWEEYGSEEV